MNYKGSNIEQTKDSYIRAGGLRLIRTLVERDRYDWGEKVQGMVEAGFYELEDLEECIASGVVTKTSADKLKDSVGQRKYVIEGRDRSGRQFYTAGKIKRAADGLLYFFITAHHQRRG